MARSKRSGDSKKKSDKKADKKAGKKSTKKSDGAGDKGDAKKDEKPKAAEKKSTTRNLAETIAILVVLVVVIRLWILESFRIPSSSMEPALIGNPYYGDRVLAWKPAIMFSSPERWSINVFIKHPDSNELLEGERSDRNFIKRAVGLPGDRFVISGGDIFVETSEEPEGHIERKPQAVQEGVWHCVYEARSGWTPNWTLSGSFTEDAAGCRVTTSGDDESTARFTRNHYDDDGGLVTNLYVREDRTSVRCPACGALGKVNIGTSRTRVTCPAPGCGHEFNILEDDIFSDVERRFVCARCSHTLIGTIDDFRSNRCPHCKRSIPRTIRKVFGVPGRYPTSRDLEVAVADMRVSCTVMPANAVGAAGIVLRIGEDRSYAVRVNLADGEVRLTGADGLEASHVAGDLGRGAPFRLSLAHVDHALEVALDDVVVIREEYERGWRACAGGPKSNEVALTARGEGVALSRPRIERDLHYLSKGHPDFFEFYDAGRRRPAFSPKPLRIMPTDGGGVGEGDAVRTLRPLAKDEYLMIGDNSPSSYDARMWGPTHKEDIVGKATILFWPPNRARMAN